MVIINALRAGKILANPALWKSVAILANALAIIISIALSILRAKGLDPMIGETEVRDIAWWIAEGLLGLNAYWHVSTSEKIGL